MINIRADTYFKEFAEIFSKRKDYEYTDFETLMYSFVKDFSKEPRKFCETIKDVIEDERYEKGNCPRCGHELETNTYKNEKVEYQGFPTREEFTGYDICQNCGWKEDL